jgi:hypothetical protein
VLHQPNKRLIGRTIMFPAPLVHEKLSMSGDTVRQWRSRLFFQGGTLQGRTYHYDALDIAYLGILREMADVGITMNTGATAAQTGCSNLVAHWLRKDGTIRLSAPKEDIDSLIDMICNDATDRPLAEVFDAQFDFDENLMPMRYLMTGGDDYDDWGIYSSLDDIATMEDFNLATVLLDLNKVAERLYECVEGPIAEFEQEGEGDKETVFVAVAAEVNSILVTH